MTPARPLPAAPRTLRPLVLDELLELTSQKATRGERVIDLCNGASRFDSSPFLDRALLGERMAQLISVSRYGEPEGREALRVRLSEQYRRDDGVEISPDRFVITDGASGALSVAFFSLLEPDDEVILPEVCFPVYPALARLAGARCVFAPLDGDHRYDLAGLQRRITARTRAIVINSPGNPYGAVLSRDRLAAILDLGVPVISDEVYRALAFDGPAASAAVLSSDHFVIDGFSKTYAAPGLRIGYAIVPERYVAVAKAVKATLNMTTSIPAQILAEVLLARSAEIVRAHVRHVARNRALFEQLARAAELRLVSSPDAGYFALLDVSSVRTSSVAIARHLLHVHRIAVCPSVDFATPDRNFFRLNVSVSAEELHLAVPLLAQALHNMPRRLQG